MKKPLIMKPICVDGGGRHGTMEVNTWWKGLAMDGRRCGMESETNNRGIRRMGEWR